MVDAKLDVQAPIGSHLAGIGQKAIWQACDWKWLPSRCRRYLRKRYARRIAGPFDVEVGAMKFRLYPAENYCDRVLFGRGELPERAEHEALLPLLQQAMVFVDIGANIGTYSVYVGTRLGGAVTLLAFEPHPRTYEKLLFNFRANGLATQHVHNIGIGPHHGVMDLWSDGGSNIGHTSMIKAGTSNPKISHQVKIEPLTALIAQSCVSKIDLLKIDIEGFEDQALAPFFDTAEEALWPAHILIEVVHQHLWQCDLLSMLEERGYGERFRTAENRLLSR